MPKQMLEFVHICGCSSCGVLCQTGLFFLFCSTHYFYSIALSNVNQHMWYHFGFSFIGCICIIIIFGVNFPPPNGFCDVGFHTSNRFITRKKGINQGLYFVFILLRNLCDWVLLIYFIFYSNNTHFYPISCLPSYLFNTYSPFSISLLSLDLLWRLV